MAAQLILMKDFWPRALCSWRALATSSLPVPLSPTMSTRASVAAARAILLRMASMAGEAPRMAGSPRRPALRVATSRFRAWCSRALRIDRRSRSRLNGFSMKS